MNNNISIDSEEDKDKLLQKIMNLIPKTEQIELKQKVETLKSANNNPPILNKNNNKSDKYDSSNETTDITPDPASGTVETTEDLNNQINKELAGEKHLFASEHISLNEDVDEEKPISLHSTITKKEKKKRENDKFSGKKRKIDDAEENLEIDKEEMSKDKESEEIRNKEKKRNEEISTSNEIETKNDDNRDIRNPEKEMLANLVKKEGFLKILNLLTVVPLNRKNPLEKKLDDIITNIGLLRATIIMFQMKWENESIKSNIKDNPNTNTINNIKNSNNSSNNNSINVNDKSDTISINNYKLKIKNQPNFINPKNKEKDENYEIVIDGVEEEESSSYKNKAKKELNEKQNEKENKNQEEKDISNDNNKNKITSSPKIKSSKKDLTKEELELGVHLQKDKTGKVYKYTKHHYRANRGNIAYVYYCADTRCKGKGCYYVKSLRFEGLKSHDLSHDEHCYIKNKDRYDKFRPIIEEFERREYHEAQIFNKSDGSQLVKWYD